MRPPQPHGVECIQIVNTPALRIFWSGHDSECVPKPPISIAHEIHTGAAIALVMSGIIVHHSS